jgi:hypothetical protein
MKMYHFFVEETGPPSFLVLARNAGYALAYLIRYMKKEPRHSDWASDWEKATLKNLPFKYKMQAMGEGEVVEIENC